MSDHLRATAEMPAAASPSSVPILVDEALSGLAEFGASETEIYAARERYETLRPRIDQLLVGTRSIPLAFAATRIHKNGQEGDALVVITDIAVIIQSVRNTGIRTRTSSVVFPRLGLTSGVTNEGGRHAVLLECDGRKVRLTLPEPNPRLEAALIKRGNRGL